MIIDLYEANINDEEKIQSEELIEKLKIDPKLSHEWLIDETEKFCQKRSMYLALTKSLKIYEGSESKESMGAIPGILSDALSVSFESNIGHDYFEDAEKRWEYYHLIENKIPFDIKTLNMITCGGVSKKSLTILMAGIHVGKTAIMCNFAADNIRYGKNVLYITLEMSEEMISERIDANLIDLDIKDVKLLSKEVYLQKLIEVKKHTIGKLKVKEYPTSQAGPAHFRYLLDELKLKENFVPDIVYIDYMNICCSSRYKPGKVSLYEYVGSIGQELRGLAVEKDIPIITATQFNREGFKSSDPGLDDVSESFGTGMIADLVLSMVRTEELDAINQIMITQLKNRYSDMHEKKRFTLGVDINRMRFYDVEEEKKIGLIDETEANKLAASLLEDGFGGTFDNFKN